jgi:hypothetical protein
MKIENAPRDNTSSGEKHSLLFFSSISPKNLSRSEKRLRLIDYRTALLQIRRLRPSNWEVILCENTLHGSTTKVSETLGIDLLDFRVSVLETNFGEKNKGIGELDMMVKAIQEFKPILQSSKTVSYLSGRRLLPNEFLFDRASRLKKEALISNPDFIYLDGKVAEVEKNNMYNDMFFTMKPKIIMKYAEYFLENRENMINLGIGSEQNLFNFIHHEGIEYEWVKQLGLIRRERSKRFGLFSRNRVHIC